MSWDDEDPPGEADLAPGPGLAGPTSGAGRPDADDRPPELADVRRYGRRLVRRFVAQARADERPGFRRILADHLGTDLAALEVVEETWPTHDHVNVQVGLEGWLAEGGREHQLVGVTDYRGWQFGLADLLRGATSRPHGPAPGVVARVNRPAGPHGEAVACVRCGVYLVTAGADRVALLLRDAEADAGIPVVSLQVVATRAEVARAVVREIRESAVARNVHRGQVLSFSHSRYDERGSLLAFHPRPRMDADDLILPPETFADLERQIVGVARHRERLRGAGQHLKRGLLLYGPPGVGKTHTVRYLTAVLRDTTVIELTGDSLRGISLACSIARALQPSLVVVEDVDLIAEDRDHYQGTNPLLFTLLNEMDGLDEDADVVFLLTTNRADLLEPALAARPGRVDQAVEIPLPDREARRRLVDLYRGGLVLDTSRLDGVLEATEGVTASFLKELLRRAAVVAATADGDAAGRRPATLAVSADALDAALADLLSTRNAMTRRVLGGRTAAE